MPDSSDVDRLIDANLYMVIGTTGEDGSPWVTPVFFAPNGTDTLYWVSSPDSRHSRYIERRSAIAITVFDSTVAVGAGAACYFEADAARAKPDQIADALDALNARLPDAKQLSDRDVAPQGSLCVYRANLRHRYVLVRGGDPTVGNELDVTLEV